MGGHGYRYPRRREARRGKASRREGCQAMKPTLKAGLKHSFSYTVPAGKTVPHLYEESPELAEMPEVFATGFMVGAHGMDLRAAAPSPSRPPRRKPRRTRLRRRSA